MTAEKVNRVVRHPGVTFYAKGLKLEKFSEMFWVFHLRFFTPRVHILLQGLRLRKFFSFLRRVVFLPQGKNFLDPPPPLTPSQ